MLGLTEPHVFSTVCRIDFDRPACFDGTRRVTPLTEKKVGKGGREKSSNVHRRDRGAVGYSGILPSDRCPQLLRLHVLPLGGVSLCSHICILGRGRGYR